MKRYIKATEYFYDGPVYHFEDFLWNAKNRTKAVSKKQALNNIRYQNMQEYIDKFDKDPSKKYSIILDEDCLQEIVDDYWEQPVSKNVKEEAERSNQLSLFDAIEESSSVEAAINPKVVTRAVEFILPILLNLLDTYWENNKDKIVSDFTDETLKRMPTKLDSDEAEEVKSQTTSFADSIYQFIRSMINEKLEPTVEEKASR